MNTQKISTFFRHTGTIASLVAAATVATAFMAPSASALSLVPETEGEVFLSNYGFECLKGNNSPTCLTLSGISIFSEVDSSTGTRSRLFVDKSGTLNTYGAVQFLPFDGGTPQEGYWFRPAAMMAAEDTTNSEAVGTQPLLESGQLEVGTFDIFFDETIESLTVRWFDTEYEGDTSFVVDGVFGSVSGVVPAGENNNIYEQTFTNVNMLTLDLGERGGFMGTGDGVDFQLEKEGIPEPASTLGLGALGLMGALGLRKRNKNLS